MPKRTPAQYDWRKALFNDRRLHKHFTSPRRSRIKHVTLHHSTIVGNGNGAALETMYKVWQNRQASANYGVDGEHVWQYVSDNDAAWANATGSNHETLSIEHTNSAGAPSWKISDKTMQTGQRLVACLHLLYGLGRPTRKTVRMHRDFYATACPGPYMVPRLNEYIAGAARCYDQMKGDKPAKPAPKPAPRPKPQPERGPLVEYISANLAGYEKSRGIRTAEHRAAREIPKYLRPKNPMWFHFQECSKPMLDELDKAFPEYERVAEGGKGRESYYRKDAGIRIIDAQLLNVKHMLLKDTKEHLVIAWEIDDHRAVDVNFHNENEGSNFQVLQLRDVMTAARKMADKHKIDRANIAVTGDANLKTAAAFAKAQGWAEAVHIAKKKIDLHVSTMSRWVDRLAYGARIDVDIFQRDADVLEAEVLFGRVISDHWPHRVLRRLK